MIQAFKSDSSQSSKSGPLRAAFLTGHSEPWRAGLVTWKYRLMRWRGDLYPDVYCVPFFLGDRVEFLHNRPNRNFAKFDLVFAELQESVEQLTDLRKLVREANTVVLPGPPEILCRSLTPEKEQLILEILRQCRYLWTYSTELKDFCDRRLGFAKATAIPWPFDLEGIRAAVPRIPKPADPKLEKIKILFQVPLRFFGVTQNFPLEIKQVLLEEWARLPQSWRERCTFHTFVYTGEDRRRYFEIDFAQGLPLILEPKRSYRSFLQLLQECAAVVNLTSASILGRVTYLAAAFQCPGIFSSNCELNRRLYPDALTPLEDRDRLRSLLREMFSGLLRGELPAMFSPSEEDVVSLGDFRANSKVVRELLS